MKYLAIYAQWVSNEGDPTKNVTLNGKNTTLPSEHTIENKIVWSQTNVKQGQIYHLHFTDNLNQTPYELMLNYYNGPSSNDSMHYDDVICNLSVGWNGMT
jgi:hypothetical protein